MARTGASQHDRAANPGRWRRHRGRRPGMPSHRLNAHCSRPPASRADEVKATDSGLVSAPGGVRDDFESRQCDHCGHLARHPLRHSRCLPSHGSAEAADRRTEDDEDRAALVLRRHRDMPRMRVVRAAAPLPPAERTTY
ncbi:hypothetical protein GWK47_027923 [Chionoecetes opilio]|uniref:Uncharacterized protein n=1 Tax=Chionoecetes opilio TaxID=41210 RepID=A0A8J4YQ00_CHIOP|nr:hypothetical protein GWK47_027923 [Chionoecetes opilio]